MTKTNKIQLFILTILQSIFPVKRIPRETKSLVVIFKIPLESNKKENWHDGFTKAIEKLKIKYKIEFFNIVDPSDISGFDLQRLNSFDLIIDKSGFRSDIELYLGRFGKILNTPVNKMISSSFVSPTSFEIKFFHCLYYETEWYNKTSLPEYNKLHAFGIDTEIMKKSKDVEKKYDYITIGAPKRYKRIEKILEYEGQKIYIGDLKNTDSYSKNLIETLRENKVEVLDFLNYQNLSQLLNESETCIINSTVHGGGERLVLEARACGLKVITADDNPKLKELKTTTIWDHIYYAQQLEKGFIKKE